jgi:hypothetical protein
MERMMIEEGMTKEEVRAEMQRLLDNEINEIKLGHYGADERAKRLGKEAMIGRLVLQFPKLAKAFKEDMAIEHCLAEGAQLRCDTDGQFVLQGYYRNFRFDVAGGKGQDNLLDLLLSVYSEYLNLIEV